MKNDTARPRVLFVDDDAILRRVAARKLRNAFDVDVYAEASCVEAAVRATTYDCFVTDLERPAVDGMEMIRRVADVDAALAERAVIFTSKAFSDRELADLSSRGFLVVMKAAPDAWERLVEAIRLRLAQTENHGPAATKNDSSGSLQRFASSQAVETARPSKSE